MHVEKYWDVKSCGPVEGHNVSKGHIAFIFRVEAMVNRASLVSACCFASCLFS
jgi:hypothetical protein